MSFHPKYAGSKSRPRSNRLRRGRATPPNGRISLFVKGSGAIPRIPKGLRLKAQSCPDLSGLLWGSVDQKSSTPRGLRLLAPGGRARKSHNPVGVVLLVALLTQGSPDGSGLPWAGRRNPFGIEQNGCAKNEMRSRSISMLKNRRGGRRFSWSACLPNRQAELIPLQRLLVPQCQIGSFECAVRGVNRTASPPQCYGGWKVRAPVSFGCAGLRDASATPPSPSIRA